MMHRPTWFMFAMVALLAWASPANARVTRIVIDSTTLLDSGAYESVSGRAFGELDPSHRRHRWRRRRRRRDGRHRFGRGDARDTRLTRLDRGRLTRARAAAQPSGRLQACPGRVHARRLRRTLSVRRRRRPGRWRMGQLRRRLPSCARLLRRRERRRLVTRPRPSIRLRDGVLRQRGRRFVARRLSRGQRRVRHRVRGGGDQR